MFMSLNIFILSTFIVTFATEIITEYRNTNLDCYISYIVRRPIHITRTIAEQ